MRPHYKVAGAATLVLFAIYRQSSTPAAAGVNPLASLVRDEVDARPLEGRVREVLSAGSYTYLSLETTDGPRWTVTMGRGQGVGTKVRVRSFGHSQNFHSKRLQRTFPDLVFGIVSRID